jgi:hypothetical protein
MRRINPTQTQKNSIKNQLIIKNKHEDIIINVYIVIYSTFIGKVL